MHGGPVLTLGSIQPSTTEQVWRAPKSTHRFVPCRLCDEALTSRRRTPRYSQSVSKLRQTSAPRPAPNSFTCAWQWSNPAGYVFPEGNLERNGLVAPGFPAWTAIAIEARNHGSAGILKPGLTEHSTPHARTNTYSHSQHAVPTTCASILFARVANIAPARPNRNSRLRALSKRRSPHSQPKIQQSRE